MGAQVTVAARKYGDLAWIEALGFTSLAVKDLPGRLEAFDLIFNTVPALLLDASRLAETKEVCLLLELASAPGGVDSRAAKALGRRLIRAPGLPGLWPPYCCGCYPGEHPAHIGGTR